jgi:hypothetical protein
MEDAAYSSGSPGPVHTSQQQMEEGQESAAAADGEEGPDPVLAAFAAACVTQEDLEEGSGAGRPGGDFMGGDYDEGYDGDGGGVWEEEESGEAGAGAGGTHVARSAAGGLLRVAPLAPGGNSTQVSKAVCSRGGGGMAVSGSHLSSNSRIYCAQSVSHSAANPATGRKPCTYLLLLLVQVSGPVDPLAWLRNLEGSSTSSSGWGVAGAWKRGGAKGARAAAKRPRVAK